MITAKLFNSIFPTAGLNPSKYNLVRKRDALINALNKFLPKYEINNYLRLCAFLGNCGIETDYFKTTIEYASGDDYDTRTSLGNTPQRDGDGRRYKGRGLTQTTGKYNYEQLTKAVGKEVGIDFVKNPERLAEIEIAVLSACVFWKDHNLNFYADRGRFKELSGIVNRGDKNKTPLHWAKRNELYSLCKRRVTADFSFSHPLPSNKNDEQNGAVQTNSPSSSDLQSNGNSVVLTPAENTDTVSTDTVTPEKSKLKEFSEKYLKHCPKDTVKNICAVVSARVGATLGPTCLTVWETGLPGKIVLIVGGLSIIGFSVYAIYKYKARIWGWVTDITDSIAPAE